MKHGANVGRLPYGKAYSRQLDEEGRRVVVDVPEQIATIARIKELHAQNVTAPQIAKILQSENRPTAAKGEWTGTGVRKLLQRHGVLLGLPRLLNEKHRLRSCLCRVGIGSMLMPSDIVDEVESVLAAAAHGSGEYPHFMTAYQILARMNEVRRLQRERGVPGALAGVHYSAASVVEQACQMLARKGAVQIEHLVTAGLSFDVTDHPPVRAGNAICGIYRVKRP